MMLTSSGALVLAGAGFATYEIVLFREGMIRELSVEAEIIGRNSTAALTYGDRSSANEALAALRAEPHIVSACIYSPDGRVFARYGKISGFPHPTPGDTHTFGRDHLVLFRQILLDGEKIGTIYIRSDLTELASRLNRYALLALAVLLVSLFVAFLLSSILQKVISEPVLHLAETARRVSAEKNYSVRAVQHGKDEIAVLIDGFNEMLDQIQARDAELTHRTAELEGANKELAAFSYSVSHDLRAPLQSIDGFSQALAEDCADKIDALGLDYITRVRAATRRMAELIDDLLTLSHVSRGERKNEQVDLSALAREIVAGLRQRDPGRDVSFVVAPGASAKGDSRLLRVVLENLLANAWKFTAKHAGARIEFGFFTREGKRAFFVKDDGAGFDMAYAGKLFGPFQRLHSMTEFEGSGIGLATVQRIIHRHGGEVWAEGEVEQGATISFTL